MLLVAYDRKLLWRVQGEADHRHGAAEDAKGLEDSATGSGSNGGPDSSEGAIVEHDRVSQLISHGKGK